MKADPLEEVLFLKKFKDSFYNKNLQKNLTSLKCLLLIESLCAIINTIMFVFKLAGVIDYSIQAFLSELILLICLLILYMIGTYYPKLAQLFGIFIILEVFFLKMELMILWSEEHKFPSLFEGNVDSSIHILAMCFMVGAMLSYNPLHISIVFLGGMVYLKIRLSESDLSFSDHVNQLEILGRLFAYLAYITYSKTKIQFLEAEKNFKTSYNHSLWTKIFDSTNGGLMIMKQEKVVLFNQKISHLLKIDSSKHSNSEMCSLLFEKLCSGKPENNEKSYSCYINKEILHDDLSEAIFHYYALAMSEKKEFHGNYKTVIHGKIINIDLYTIFLSEEDHGIILIISDITEIRKMDEQKANLNAKIKLLASISHQLLTPINGIVTHLYAIKSIDNLSDELEEWGNNAYNSALFLWNYINNIIAYTEIETDEFKLTDSQMYLEEVVKEVIDINYKEIRDRELYFSLEYSNEIPNLIYSDRFRVRQILLNLMQNAIHHSCKGGEIYMKVKKVEFDKIKKEKYPFDSIKEFSSGYRKHHSAQPSLATSMLGSSISSSLFGTYQQYIQISIKDNGIGIRKEHLKKIFYEFQFEEEDGINNKQNTKSGLKLAVSRMIIHFMEGRIFVKSTIGKGTRFTLFIPIKPNKIDELYSDSDESLEEREEIVRELFNIAPNNNGIAQTSPMSTNPSKADPDSGPRGMHLSNFENGSYLFSFQNSCAKLLDTNENNALLTIHSDSVKKPLSSERQSLMRLNQKCSLLKYPEAEESKLMTPLESSMEKKEEFEYFEKKQNHIFCASLSRINKSIFFSGKDQESTIKNSCIAIPQPLDPSRPPSEIIDFPSIIIHDINEENDDCLSSETRCSCKDILIVDDNNFNIMAAQTIFRIQGISSDKATNGEEAIEIIKKRSRLPCCNKYKMIIMDCNMPIMNGFTASKKIKELVEKGEFEDTPIIGHSAFNSKGQIKQCFKSGMTDYVMKPLRHENVVTLIKKYHLK